MRMQGGEPVGPAQFSELYDCHAGAVRRYVRSRIRDPHLAEDIVQETFLRVYRFGDRLDPERSALPWIKAIAATMCSNALRGRRHQVEVLVDDVAPVLTLDALASATTAPDEHCVRVEERHRVAGVLLRLPPRHRAVLVLKEVDQLSCSEIASLEGTSPEVVKAVLARARAAFRRAHALPAAVALKRRLRARLPDVHAAAVVNVAVAERLVPVLTALVVVGSTWAAPSSALTMRPPVEARSGAAAPAATGGTTAAGGFIGATVSSVAPGPGETTAEARKPARALTVSVAPTTASAAGAVVARGSDEEMTLDGEVRARVGEEQPYVGGVGSVRCDGEARQHVCRAVAALPAVRVVP